MQLLYVGAKIMITIQEWLINLSETCSVQRFEDIESGIFKEKIKDDIYLVSHEDVKEK